MSSRVEARWPHGQCKCSTPNRPDRAAETTAGQMGHLTQKSEQSKNPNLKTRYSTMTTM